MYAAKLASFILRSRSFTWVNAAFDQGPPHLSHAPSERTHQYVTEPIRLADAEEEAWGRHRHEVVWPEVYAVFEEVCVFLGIFTMLNQFVPYSHSRAMEYVMQQQRDDEALSVAVTLAAIYLCACDTTPTPFA